MITLQTEYRKKHKKIIKLMNISDNEKMHKIANINVTKAAGKDGVAVFVHKKHSNYIKLHNFIVDNRGVILNICNQENQSLLLHLIYGPSINIDKVDF